MAFFLRGGRSWTFGWQNASARAIRYPRHHRGRLVRHKLPPLVSVLAATLIALTSAGPAAAIGGSADDPRDVPPAANGHRYPDVERLTVEYEPSTGTLLAVIHLHDPLAYDLETDKTRFGFEIGSFFTPDGECVTHNWGDLHVSGNWFKDADGYGDSWVEAVVAGLGGGHDKINAYGGGGGGEEGRVLKFLFKPNAHDLRSEEALVNRDYKCVTNAFLDTTRFVHDEFGERHEVLARDRVSDFCFSGACATNSPDQSAPELTWISPTPGQTISGYWGGEDCRVDASDDFAVHRVAFAFDNRVLGVSFSAPWTCPWIDTTDYPNGPYALSATAYDAAGNSRKVSISVTIRNEPNVIGGTAGANVITGTWREDVIYAGGGNDTVRALARNDVVYGGRGNDVLYGNGDDDRLYGGPGRDRLYGGPGTDRTYGRLGVDTCQGEIRRSC